MEQEQLKERLDYDPLTGEFRWRHSTSSRAQKGSKLDSYNSDGYLRVKIDNNHYMLHRLAFIYMEGYLPEHEVDHINGVRSDNRWCNLRHVTKFCNMQNCKKSSLNTSGFPGVSLNKREGRWKAYGEVQRKQCSLGTYATALDAALARFTFENEDPRWTCNSRSQIYKSIKSAWPEFNPRLSGCDYENSFSK